MRDGRSCLNRVKYNLTLKSMSMCNITNIVGESHIGCGCGCGCGKENLQVILIYDPIQSAKTYIPNSFLSQQ